MHTNVKDYPWQEELEKTLIHSLTTSFGLDFLLFEDKTGGNVDTVHNVRNGIWASEQEQQRYEQRPAYDSAPYHQHDNYIQTGRHDKQQHRAGQLHDAYRNQAMTADELKKRDLDHVISANEIHNDPGRVLAELDGVELANQSTNLRSTHSSVNRSKQQLAVEEYLTKLPDLISSSEQRLAQQQARLAAMPRDTPEQQHKARELQSSIQNEQQKLDTLKAVDADAMRAADQTARAAYNSTINVSYYTSSKFLTATAVDMGKAGLKMGTRQMLGLVLAELWFEMRAQMPALLQSLQQDFALEPFVSRISTLLRNTWARIQTRFREFLTAFKNGVFAGAMSSLTTTLLNIFATTQKLAIKIIREIWSQLVTAIKVILFNPDQLPFTQLCQTVTNLLAAAAATVAGSMVHAQLLPVLSFPFGAELAAFAGALVTGVLTLGLSYFILHSRAARTIWAYIDSLCPHADSVREFQNINAELDRYLTEFSRIEFNLDLAELDEFVNQLNHCHHETLKNALLRHEVTRNELELPFEMGNTQSTRRWLKSLVK